MARTVKLYANSSVRLSVVVIWLSVLQLPGQNAVAEEITLGTKLSRTTYEFGGSKQPSVSVELPELPKAVPGPATLNIAVIQPQNSGAGQYEPLQGAQLELINIEFSLTSPGVSGNDPLSLFLYDTVAAEELAGLAAVGISLSVSGGVINTNSSGGFSFQPYSATLSFQNVSGKVFGKQFTASDLSISLPQFIPKVSGIAVLQALELQITAAFSGRIVISEILSTLGGDFQKYAAGAGDAYIDYKIIYFGAGLLPTKYIGSSPDPIP